MSESGLERLRLQRRLRRAGLDVSAAVDPWASEAQLDRVEWDVVVWAAPRAERLARTLVRRTDPHAPILLVLAEDASGAAASSALGAGFADVVCAEGPRGELAARAHAVARRHTALRGLRDEVAAFRELAEGGRDLLIRQAPDGMIRYASAAATEILGRDPASLVGRRASSVFHPDVLRAATRPYAHRVRCRDGAWVWMETTARLLHDASGRVCEIHTNSRDVSERVRAEAERASLARVTAAVAEGLDVEVIAERVAREAAGLVGAESGAVMRLRGSDGVVVGAVGPTLRPGDRMPLATVHAECLVAPVTASGRLWGLVVARGLGGAPATDALVERLRHLAPLVGLAVSNSRSRERLVALATTDPLTGLANHRAFHRRLEGECSRARRAATALTLVMIDLDHFKRVNDTYGHQVGDEVLCEVARRLVDCGRREDIAARVGGEELAWLLPDTDLAQGMKAAERLRRRIGETDFPTVGRLTASLGISTLGTGDRADLLRGADLALYRAKDGGRDACVAWEEAVRAAPSA